MVLKIKQRNKPLMRGADKRAGGVARVSMSREASHRRLPSIIPSHQPTRSLLTQPNQIYHPCRFSTPIGAAQDIHPTFLSRPYRWFHHITLAVCRLSRETLRTLRFVLPSHTRVSSYATGREDGSSFRCCYKTLLREVIGFCVLRL